MWIRRALVASCLAFVACSSSYEVYDVSKMVDANQQPIRQKKNLLYYALPRHVVSVEIPVTHTTTEAPTRCTDATLRDRLFLKDEDVLKNETVFELGQATITTYSEPDPKAVYAIGFDRAPLHKLTHVFELTEAGLLSTGKSSVENQSADLTVSVLKGVAGIAGAVIGAGSPTARTAGITQCEQIARDIETLRGERDQLLLSKRNAMFPSKEALEYSLGQLATRENELLSQFIGTTTKKVSTVQCRFTPLANPASADLFQFSATDGVVSVTAACVAPPAASAKKQTGASGFPVTLSVQLDPADQLATVVKSVVKDHGPTEGLFYRIPATTLSTVTWRTKDTAVTPAVDKNVLKGRTTLALAQLGVVNAFPGGKDVKSFKSNYQAILYPASGALQKLDLTTESGGTASAGAVTAAAEGAATVINTQQAREIAQTAARKAEETAAAAEEKLANDELLRLERERKILEERKKIVDLQKELEKTQPPQ